MKNTLKRISIPVIGLSLFLASSLASSETIKTIPVSATWQVYVDKDEMTDKVTCTVINRGDTPIDVVVKASADIAWVTVVSVGRYMASGFIYRADAGEPVKIGRMYPGGDGELVSGDEFFALIEAFKKGSNVAVRAYPENQFVKTANHKFSLSGFTKAYSIAKTCDF